MTVATQLAQWCLDLRASDIPTTTTHAVRRHLADGLGNAVAARRTHEADFALAMADRFATEPAASIIGGGTAGLEGAAFVNGVLIHALDFDDTHAGALVHVTAITAPVALAISESTRASVSELLAATTAGIEIAARIGMAVTHGFHERGFHATSVVGPYVAAAIAARLWGLSLDETVAALGIAGSMSSGSLEFLHTPASTKQIHPGWAALGGLTAARLAAEGATGPDTTLDGTFGLFELFTNQQPDLKGIAADLGNRWEAERVTIKPYPVCQLTHASLDAVATLPTIEAADIERVRVHLPSGSMPIVAEPLADKLAPATPYDAKFSAQWDVAALLIDGSLGVDTFSNASIARTDVRQLAERVEVLPTSYSGVPASAPGHVEVITTGGETHVGTVARSHGTPDLPLDDDALFAKLALNMGSASAAAAVVDALSAGDGPADAVVAATREAVAA